eukprot:6183204-Pleurochrysis_carterae.AAC.3
MMNHDAAQASLYQTFRTLLLQEEKSRLARDQTWGQILLSFLCVADESRSRSNRKPGVTPEAESSGIDAPTRDVVNI